MKDEKPLGQDIHLTSCVIDSYISTNITGSGKKVLTGIEGLTLGFLAHDDHPKTTKDVMERFHIAKATASQTLSGLEKKGMIRQEAYADDKRRKQIMLTDEGREIQDTIDEKFAIMNSTLEEGISEEEKETFRKVLFKIRCNLGRNY